MRLQSVHKLLHNKDQDYLQNHFHCILEVSKNDFKSDESSKLYRPAIKTFTAVFIVNHSSNLELISSISFQQI